MRFTLPRVKSRAHGTSGFAKVAGTAQVLGRVSLGGAVVLSVYLCVSALLPGGVAGCDDDCFEVLHSPWARVFGVPVGGLGVLVYSVRLAATTRRWVRVHGLTRVAVAADGLVVGGALWFVGLQGLVLGAFCPWCCATHALAVLGVLGLNLAGRRTGSAAQDPRGRERGRGARGDTRSSRWLPLALAAGLMGLLAAAQVLEVRALAARARREPSAPTTAAAPSDSPDWVEVHGGKFRLNAAELPVIGPRTARRWVVGLLDHTCFHCRALEGTLSEVSTRGPSNGVAVVVVPAYRNAEGRAVQRLMLAVWRQSPSDYATLGRLLRSGALPAREPALRTAIANRLGTDWLARLSETDISWIEAQLQLAAQIREYHRQRVGTDGLPQLAAGNTILVGAKPVPRILAWLGEAAAEAEMAAVQGSPMPEAGAGVEPGPASGAPEASLRVGDDLAVSDPPAPVIGLPLPGLPLRAPLSRTLLATVSTGTTPDSVRVDLPEALRRVGVEASVAPLTAAGKLPICLRFPSGFQVPGRGTNHLILVRDTATTNVLMRIDLEP